MRHVLKGEEPIELSRRRSELQATPGAEADYYSLLDYARLPVLHQCLREQGWLCAYTNVRIDTTKAHLEHMFPQSHCDPLETIDYRNIVACFPAPNQPHPGFGARLKDDWPARHARKLLLRPTDASCENRLRYDPKTGTAEPASADDAAAIETVNRLGLNREPLLNWRRDSLAELLGISNIKALTQRLRQVANADRPEEYCVAKRQWLERRIQRLAAVRKYAHTSGG